LPAVGLTVSTVKAPTFFCACRESREESKKKHDKNRVNAFTVFIIFSPHGDQAIRIDPILVSIQVSEQFYFIKPNAQTIGRPPVRKFSTSASFPGFASRRTSKATLTTIFLLGKSFVVPPSGGISNRRPIR
jgi:hypothetical protein